MRLVHSVFWAVLTALAVSCSSRLMTQRLDAIEKIIEDRPDSALVILRTLSQDNLDTRELKARFSLLYAMALDKNGVDTTDRTIIEPAIQYYQKHGTVDSRMKALYYQGIAYLNGGEFDNAIVSFSAAEELVSKSSDMRYVGLLYSRISDLYNLSHNSVDELKYVNLAADVFAENGIEKYKYSTMLRKGEALTGLSRYDEAESIFITLLDNPMLSEKIRTTAKEDYALLLLSRNNRDSGKALTLLNEVITDAGALRNTNLWAAYAYALADCGHFAESERVFAQLYDLADKDYSIVDIWSSAAKESKGDYRDALGLLRKSLTYQDSLLNIRLLQATASAQNNHLALRNAQLQVESKNQRIRLMTLIFILALMLIISYIIYHSRVDRLWKEREELASIADTMRLQMREAEMDLSSLRSEYARMYKSQFKTLGEICEAYLLANEKKDSQRIMYEKVQRMLKDISGDSDGQKRFERMIDKSLSNIMRHFREEFPKYSEEDYRFISYVFVGFDATLLSIIFNMPSVDAVYMKKLRIKKTILKSDAVYKDMYLTMLT